MKTYIFPLRFDTLKSALCHMSYNQWVRDCRRVIWRGEKSTSWGLSWLSPSVTRRVSFNDILMLVESSSTCQTSWLYTYFLSWLVSSSFWHACHISTRTFGLCVWWILKQGGECTAVAFPWETVCDPGLKAARDLELLLPATPFVRGSWCNGLEKAYEFFGPNLCWKNEWQVLCFTPSLLLSPLKATLFVHFVRAVLRVDACVLWENVRAYNLSWLISIWIQREQVLSFGIGFDSGLVT